MAIDMLQMFFGILILSFVVERFFEIISSLLEYKFCHVKDETKKKWSIYTDLDEALIKEFEPIKKLIFTPLGLIVGLVMVSITEVSILHDTGLLSPNAPPLAYTLDKLLTVVVISWGTGPIHSFIGSLEKYKMSD